MASWLRKNIISALLVTVMVILLFVPNAKAYFLKGLLGTGLFNAGTTKQTKSPVPVAGILLIDASGRPVNTADLRGKVIFINFWATWCPPCIAEMGSVQALYNTLKNDPRIVFILADADNNPQLATAFMQKHDYDLPVYQLTGQVPENLFSGTLPTTLIIDSKGNLAQQHEGIANYNTHAMRVFLQSL